MTVLLEAITVCPNLEFLTDDELFYAYAQGHVDRDAGFAELHARWDDCGRRLLSQLCVPVSDQDDMMQLAYQHVHQYRDSFQPNVGAKTWFKTAVRNCVRNERTKKQCKRRTSVHKSKQFSIHDEIDVKGSPVPLADLIVDEHAVNPLDALIHEEEGILARRAVAKLPDHLREVIELRFFEDLSNDDMRARLGITRGTVKSRLRRALNELRNMLETNDEE